MADDLESCTEEDRGYKSSQPHPTMSSEGIIKWCNFYRARGNTKEKMLQGKVPDSTIESIAEASQKTGVPQHLLVHCLDFKNDITSGGDANGVAHEIIQHTNALRSVMGRDPFNGEILAAVALGGAGQVKQIYEKSQKKPEHLAEGGGGAKADIIYKKLRNDKLVKRTNREVYEFFKQRMLNGNSMFTKFLGNTDTVVSALGSNPIASTLTSQMNTDNGIINALGGGSTQGLSTDSSNLVSSIQGMDSLFSNSDQLSGDQEGKSFFPKYAAADKEDDDSNNTGEGGATA